MSNSSNSWSETSHVSLQTRSGRKDFKASVKQYEITFNEIVKFNNGRMKAWSIHQKHLIHLHTYMLQARIGVQRYKHHW